MLDWCYVFSPEIDSRSMRYGLLVKQHADVLGETKQFDGASLYLPFKLEQPVSKTYFC